MLNTITNQEVKSMTIEERHIQLAQRIRRWEGVIEQSKANQTITRGLLIKTSQQLGDIAADKQRRIERLEAGKQSRLDARA